MPATQARGITGHRITIGDIMSNATAATTSTTNNNKMWEVVCLYDGSPYGDRGDIVSRHYSYELAEKATRNDGGWLGIREVSPHLPMPFPYHYYDSEDICIAKYFSSVDDLRREVSDQLVECDYGLCGYESYDALVDSVTETLRQDMFSRDLRWDSDVSDWWNNIDINGVIASVDLAP
jgi:hypothetical protein